MKLDECGIWLQREIWTFLEDVAFARGIPGGVLPDDISLAEVFEAGGFVKLIQMVEMGIPLVDIVAGDEQLERRAETLQQRWEYEEEHPWRKNMSLQDGHKIVWPAWGQIGPCPEPFEPITAVTF